MLLILPPGRIEKVVFIEKPICLIWVMVSEGEACMDNHHHEKHQVELIQCHTWWSFFTYFMEQSVIV